MIIAIRKQWNRVAVALCNERFINALRTTVTIVIPVIVGYRSGFVTEGIDIGLGTLLVGLSDTPGNLYEKSSALLVSSLTLALVSLAVVLVLPSALLLGIVLVAFCFTFSMLTLYGGSVSTISSIALIMLVFTMGLRPANSAYFSVMILAGGLWYTLFSTLYSYFFPYRPMRQALSECIAVMADFLRSKACFYQSAIPLNECYRQVISGHVRVSEKQEAVRSMLLKEQMVLFRNDRKVKQMIRLAIELIDLYEQILAIHYDYVYIRQTLDELDVLPCVNGLMQHMADELEEIGAAIMSRRIRGPRPAERIKLLSRQLKNAAAATTGLKAGLIGRLIANFEMIDTKIGLIGKSLNRLPGIDHLMSGSDAIRFGNDQPFHWKQLFQHLTIRSAVFRFALRITLTCLGAYLATLFLLPGKYSYWVLLTIIIVARPGYSTTRRRSYQRITGTLIGIAAAFILLSIAKQNSLQSLLVVFFLLGYLNFLSVNYLVSVVFITIVAIVGLHLLGGNDNDLLLQRGYETLLGGAAALTAAFLVPFWESWKLKDLVSTVILANIAYLEQLRDLVLQHHFDLIGYKLARKQVFVSSANLSQAYQHILTEPGRDITGIEMLYQLQIFNHELYASVASLFLGLSSGVSDDLYTIEMIDKSIAYLNESLKTLNANTLLIENVKLSEINFIEGTLHNAMLHEQLQLIVDLTRNIYLQVNQIEFTGWQ